jgi:hypothetical protein
MEALLGMGDGAPGALWGAVSRGGLTTRQRVQRPTPCKGGRGTIGVAHVQVGFTKMHNACTLLRPQKRRYSPRSAVGSPPSGRLQPVCKGVR